MQEHRARPYPRRASATPQELAARRTPPVASTHRTGHNAGLHPEDAPYLSGTGTRTVADEVEEDEAYYPQRRPSSARRYTTTAGQQVIEQGNKRMVIHKEPPPKHQRRFHWLFWVGLVLLTMVLGWIALTLFLGWWQTKQVEWQYGTPRTFQTDQVVGHADSAEHPTHFIAVNVGGTIEVVELNATSPKNDHVYVITTSTDSSTPVTLGFADVNHDGKLDLLVRIGTLSSYTVVLLNDGTVFKPS